MVKDENLERVPPSEIEKGDVLLLADKLESEWADVLEISERLPKTRCDADNNPNRGGVHELDAFHFTCDIFNLDGNRVGRRVICEPVGVVLNERTLVNKNVVRSIQK